MQIEEMMTTGNPFNGTPHYFTAVLFEDWEFWTAGPSGPTLQGVQQELALYQHVSRAQIVKTYVPLIH